jgi:hypothetical protein
MPYTDKFQRLAEDAQLTAMGYTNARYINGALDADKALESTNSPETSR